jgi:hypothetical protein
MSNRHQRARLRRLGEFALELGLAVLRARSPEQVADDSPPEEDVADAWPNPTGREPWWGSEALDPPYRLTTTRSPSTSRSRFRQS